MKVSFSRFAGLGLVAAIGMFGLAYAAATASEENSAAVERLAADTPPHYSSWAADPASPGPDLPPAGRSLFDHLFTETEIAGDARTYHLPFPFSELIERIGAHLGNQEFMGGLRVAIIPTGRSLQRVAAAPEFFRYPRTVIAVTGEPRTDARDPGMLLKDRLYIAYVEKTATLEVISYNEAAGRFEFQLVKDYRAGARPKVFYADRAICIACHQNHAPIFSRPIWGETNANGRVAEMLRTHQTDMHLSGQANIDFPDQIEKAAMRASDLVTLQTVWQLGCKDERDQSQSRRCRAAAFAAVLQYGLSGRRDFDSNLPRYHDDFVATLSRTWSRRWPHGLRVAQSSLPDRDPFGTATASYGGGSSDQSDFDWMAAARVPPDLDPLTPRPAREIWRVSGGMDTPRVISGWANFFAEDDFRTLDRFLVQRESDAELQPAVYPAQCTAKRNSASSGFNLQCTADPGAERSANLVARVEEHGKGRIDWLNFGPAGTLRDVDLTGNPAQLTNAEYVLRLAPKKAALSTRLPDGRRLAGVEIRWHADSAKTGGEPDSEAQSIEAQFEATVVDDFALVRGAIDRLLEHDPRLFDSVPLMRAKLMPALLEELGTLQKSTPETNWCCLDDTGMPTATLDAPEVDAAVVSDEKLQPFFRYCATCHLTAERFPPNFLSGKASQVSENLRRCAPRMLVRLSAWGTPEEQRVKSPMPPATALRALGTTAKQWAHSAELEELRSYVEQLAQGTGELDEAYEGLPSCLPTAQ